MKANTEDKILYTLNHITDMLERQPPKQTLRFNSIAILRYSASILFLTIAGAIITYFTK